MVVSFAFQTDIQTEFDECFPVSSVDMKRFVELRLFLEMGFFDGAGMFLQSPRAVQCMFCIKPHSVAIRLNDFSKLLDHIKTSEHKSISGYVCAWFNSNLKNAKLGYLHKVEKCTAGRQSHLAKVQPGVAVIVDVAKVLAVYGYAKDSQVCVLLSVHLRCVQGNVVPESAVKPKEINISFQGWLFV